MGRVFRSGMLFKYRQVIFQESAFIPADAAERTSKTKNKTKQNQYLVPKQLNKRATIYQIYIIYLRGKPPLDKLSNHRILSNLFTLPAESISKGTEKHDGMLIIF